MANWGGHWTRGDEQWPRGVLAGTKGQRTRAVAPLAGPRPSPLLAHATMPCFPLRFPSRTPHDKKKSRRRGAWSSSLRYPLSAGSPPRPRPTATLAATRIVPALRAGPQQLRALGERPKTARSRRSRERDLRALRQTAMASGQRPIASAEDLAHGRTYQPHEQHRAW